MWGVDFVSVWDSKIIVLDRCVLRLVRSSVRFLFVFIYLLFPIVALVLMHIGSGGVHSRVAVWVHLVVEPATDAGL